MRTTYPSTPPSLSASPPVSPPVEQPELRWELHPVCGLIHTSGSKCKICSNLVVHIREVKMRAATNALEEGEAASFAAALAALHLQNDVGYHQGLEAGRRLERENMARSSENNSPSQEDKKELKVVTKKEALPECNPVLRVAEPQESSPVRGQSSMTREHVDAPHNRQVFCGTGRKKVPQEYYSMIRSPIVDTYLESLMKDAHAGDFFACNRIRALARQAHATPRDEKSYGQKYVLTEWRNPNAPTAAERRQNGSEGPILANPRLDDPIEDWFTYYTIHGSSLPRGVRRDVNGDPWLPDLRASRIYAQLRPSPSTTPTATKTDFAVYSMELMLAEGVYETILANLSIPVGNELRPSAYDGPVKLTMEDVARHFAKCGLSVQLLKRDMAPWAKEYQSPR
ncbi:hypothetical protein L218DRAFT_76004 [Marasmius fiardii PR-910]|nr:hypothetical protein L218DRAFT_76004 [Marasmius fiardii PR-910]